MDTHFQANIKTAIKSYFLVWFNELFKCVRKNCQESKVVFSPTVSPNLKDYQYKTLQSRKNLGNLSGTISIFDMKLVGLIINF